MIKCAQGILGFITNLPPSLQELYIEINGPELTVDKDSDFDPLCDLGNQIFTILCRLHTCDIHVWVTVVEDGLRVLPEKAVFYRRRPHHPKPSDQFPMKETKEIWTSRMDCVDGGEDPRVRKECEVVTADFEGVDAEDIWCGGYTFQVSGETPKERWKQSPLETRDFSWPFWEDKIKTYSGFRKLHYDDWTCGSLS